MTLSGFHSQAAMRGSLLSIYPIEKGGHESGQYQGGEEADNNSVQG